MAARTLSGVAATSPTLPGSGTGPVPSSRSLCQLDSLGVWTEQVSAQDLWRFTTS
jgi:hypothetical protein